MQWRLRIHLSVLTLVRASGMLFALFLSWPAASQTDSSRDLQPQGGFVVLPNCEARASSREIVVCAEREPGRSRYRIPQGVEAPPPNAVSRRVIAGSVISHGTQVSADAPCGPFQGQRTCSTAEAALYGYENGRDPITFIISIIHKATDK